MSRPSPRRRALLVVVAASLVTAARVSADRSVSSSDTSLPQVTEPTGAPTTERAPQPRPSEPAPLGDFELTAWEDCDDGLQCSTLEVPLDWNDPDGEQISLAVARKPAIGPGERIGAVLFNPGGPGEPGTKFLRETIGAERTPAGLDERFDLVAWDPRGTGGSAGVRCQTEADLLKPDLDPTLDSPEDVAAAQAAAATGSQQCIAAAGDVLPFVGTRNSARDLDALRSALGDEQLTYVGYSYGTTLGTVYAQLFPENVRALVLDGVSIPGGDPVVDTLEQARSFEKNLGDFFDECDSRLTCLFGDGDSRQAFADIVAELEAGERVPGTYSLPDEDGVEHQRRGDLGIGELYRGVLVTLYSRDNWPALEQALAGVANDDAKMLLYLRDVFAGRQDDGTWSYLGDANAAINCADQQIRPADGDGDDALRLLWSAELPLLGGVFATGTPGCFGFPAGVEPLVETTAADLADAPPVVLVGSTGDAATPYQQTLDLQALWPGSSLVTWESEDHTAYGRGSECLDDPITEYLETLVLPDDGLTCAP